MNTRIAKVHLSASRHYLPTRLIRAFLAEDSPVTIILLARALAKDRRIFIAGCASDGRKALGASSLRPDLVVTDLHMPGLDGAELTLRLKQQPNPPIIVVVTSDDTPEARARCVAAGADAFLVKGANLGSQLVSVIQEFFPEDLDEHDAEHKHFCERFTTLE